jgi:PleD family two-component response regulator
MKNIILIIDSDTVTLNRLRNILSREGFSLMTATNLATAKEIMQQVDISYVLAQPDFCTEFRSLMPKKTDELKENIDQQ